MRNLAFYLLLTISFNSFGSKLSDGYLAMRKVYEEGTILQAKEEALKFLSLAKRENDSYYLVKTYFMLGYLASHSDDYGNAVIYYLEGARIADQAEDIESKTTLIYICKNLGRILGDYQHYELAHKFINQGLEVASVLDNQEQIKQLLENRIHELIEEQLFPEAIQQIDSFNSLFQLEGERLLEMKNKEGVAYLNIGQKPKAIFIFKYIIQKGNETGSEVYVRSLQNLGSINFNSGEYKKALELFKKQIVAAKSESLDQLLFQAFEMAGKTYTGMGDYENAIDLLKEAIILDDKGDLKPDTYTVYEKLSSAYEKKGDIREALNYKNLYAQKLEAFIARQKEIEELDKKYNIQLLTERYFDLLAASKKQEKTENIAKIGGCAIVLIFILIIFNIYYKRYRVKRSLQEELRKIQLMEI